MIKVKTGSGFECEIRDNIGDDYRVLKAIRGLSEDPLAFLDLVELILGADGADALEKHIESLEGYVSTAGMDREITEIFNAVKDLKK